MYLGKFSMKKVWQLPELKLQKIFFVCEEMNVIVTRPNYELWQFYSK